MEIVGYEAGLADDVVSLYNRAVSGLPHCYPVDADRLDAAIGRVHQAAESGDSEDGAAFVALADGRAVGFVDVGVAQPREWGEGRQGVICFLYYLSGQRAAGQALLDAAERHIAEQDVPLIQAFPQEWRYPFYDLHAAYLSDRLGHIEGLLGMNGYERVRGEVMLDWPDFRPVVPGPPDSSADVDVSLPEGRGRLPGVRVRAEIEGTYVGQCACVSGGEYAPDQDAQEWVEVVDLRVTRDQQGHGWGRHLLLRALHEAREAGYRHAAISCHWHNDRALLFYSNYGFRVVDMTYGWGREL